jgi:hypothetical protein
MPLVRVTGGAAFTGLNATVVTVAGLAGILAGDLVVLFLQGGREAGVGVGAALPALTYPAGIDELQQSGVAGCSTGSGFGGETALAWGMAAGGEASFAVTLAAARDYASLYVDVYRGLGAAIAVSGATFSTDCDGGVANIALPGVTPPAGSDCVIFAGGFLCPDYHPTFTPAAWSNHTELTGGNRQSMRTADRLISGASGTYTGTYGNFGAETAVQVHVAAFTAGDEPAAFYPRHW